MKTWGNLFNASKSTEKTSRTSEHKSQNESILDDEDVEMVAVIEESERFKGSWSADHLMPNDPLRFKSSAGQSSTFPNPPLAEGWEWVGVWEVEKYSNEGSTPLEWIYGFSFEDIERGIGSLEPFNRTKGQYLVRRKRWIRTVKPSSSPSLKPVVNPTVSPAKSTHPPQTSTPFKLSETPDKRTSIGEESVILGDEFDPSVSADVDAVIGAADAKFEVEFDADEADLNISHEPEESDRKMYFPQFQTNFLSSNGHTNLPAEFNIRVRDPSLVAIGKQIKAIEAECKSMDDSDNSDWIKYNKPALVIQIRELEKVCEAFKEKIDKEVHKGLDHITALEEELRSYTNRLEEAKKKFYFPQSFMSIGQGGIYMALDDFWLENASGHFDIDLIPSKDAPEIQITLTGSKDKDGNTSGGMSFRLRVDGFKLAGDKGKRIPKFKFDEMKVLVSLRASIFIHYEVNTSKWIVKNPKNFKIELLSFKGPYGITQR
jgi:hypothetical protein